MSKLSAVEEILAKLKSTPSDIVRPPAHVPELPKGGLDIFPLETPHVGPSEVPLYADTPEAMQDLKALMAGDKDVAKKFAEQAGAAKEKALEADFANKQAFKKGIVTREDATPVLSDIFNPTGESTNLVGKGFNALGYAQRKALNAIANQIGATGQSPVDSEKSSQAIVERAAEKLGIPETSTAGNMAKALGVGALEVFADPLGLPFSKIGKLGKAAGILKAAEHTAPAAKLASDSQKAEAVKKALGLFNKNTVASDVGQAMKQAVPTVQEDVQKLVNAKKAEEAMKVLNYKSTEPTMAQKLATRGAPVVKPVGPIIRSK